MERLRFFMNIIVVLTAMLMVSCSDFEDSKNTQNDVFSPNLEYSDLMLNSCNSVTSSHALTKLESIALVVQSKGTYKISESEAIGKLEAYVASNAEVMRDILVKSTVLKKNSKTGKDMYYEVVFENAKGTGFSLVSADERVPEVLCFIEKGSIVDTVYNRNLKFCLELVDIYVEENTKEELDIELLSFSAKEKLQNTVFKKNNDIPVNDVETNETQNVRGEIPMFSPDYWTYEYTWVNVTYPEVLKYVPCKWFQDAPYNDLLPFINGNTSQRAYVGCGMVAVAHIMAYHKKTYLGYINTSTWNTMINAYPSVHTYTKSLMKDLFDNMKDSFDIHGTYTTNPKILQFLNSNSYNAGSFVYFNRHSILNALSWGPTIITGYTIDDKGHAWVIDAYSGTLTEYFDHYSYLYKGKLYEHDELAGELESSMVRFNWGLFYGVFDGWFYSGVFEFPGGNNYNIDVNIISSIK